MLLEHIVATSMPTHFLQWKTWTPGGWRVTRTELGMAITWTADLHTEQTDFMQNQLTALGAETE